MVPQTELERHTAWSYKVRLGRARRWTATMCLDAADAAGKTLAMRLYDRHDRKLAEAELDPETLRIISAATTSERAYWLLARTLAAYTCLPER